MFSSLKNKDIRILMENFISLSTLQIVGMILPLITLPYVVRVVGFSNYGIIALASSLIAYFQSVTDYSFRITATRDVVIYKHSTKRLSLIYSKVQIVKAIFSFLSLTILLIIVFLYPPFYKERLVFFLTMPILLGYTLFPEWFFQGIENMKYITILNICIKVFFTICIFIFIKKETDYWVYPLLQSCGFIGGGIVGQFILHKKYRLKFFIIKPSSIKKTVTDNFPIFINQFVPNLYNNTSTFLLGIFSSNNIVGIYDAIKKITDLSVALINIFSRVFFPFINRRKDVFKKYSMLMFSVGSLLVFLPIIFSKLIFFYLNVSYPNAFEVLTILSLSVFFVTLYDIYGLNYFIVNRQDKLVMKNTIVASIIGFILAFPLIYWSGIIGAALNVLISRIIMGGGLFYKYKRFT